MSATFKPNNTRISQDPVEVSVSIEQEEPLFLAINAETVDGQTRMDLYTTDPSEIEEFFRNVEEARVRWVSYLATH